MKAFSFSCGEIIEGLKITEDQNLGPVVYLGEQGRGRSCKKIALYRHDPAEIVDNKIVEARMASVVIKDQTYITLAKTKEPEGRVLVRINTDTGYVRGAKGCWEVIEGLADCIISGYGAFGDAGRVGNWDDGLFILYSGAVIQVKGSRYGNWVIAYKDGQLEAMNFSDWQIRQAINSEKNEGGVTWL